MDQEDRRYVARVLNDAIYAVWLLPGATPSRIPRREVSSAPKYHLL